MRGSPHLSRPRERIFEAHGAQYGRGPAGGGQRESDRRRSRRAFAAGRPVRPGPVGPRAGTVPGGRRVWGAAAGPGQARRLTTSTQPTGWPLVIGGVATMYKTLPFTGDFTCAMRRPKKSVISASTAPRFTISSRFTLG